MGREEFDKKLIGLYGEMELALRLHKEGWQVYRAYIDELIDFVISRYYCSKCKKYTELFIRKTKWRGKKGTNKKEEITKCKTNLCHFCKTDSITIKTKFIQVKTSAGINSSFSFHPKLSHLIKDLFCVWISIKNHDKPDKKMECDFFIFKGLDIPNFDNINLDSYQKTDNQKITLTIDKGKITTQTKVSKWSELNNFQSFDILKEP